MLKFVLFIAKWFAVIAVINFLYGLALIKTDWSIQSTIEFFHKYDDNIDVLVVGNSLGLDGIDAEMISKKLNINCYNACIGGGSLSEALFRTEYAIDHNNIKTVILASNIDYIRDCGDEHVVTSNFRSDYYLFQNFLFNYQFFHIDILKKFVSQDYRSNQIQKGQLKIESTYIDSTKIDYSQKEFFLNDLNCFLELKETLESKNIKLIFVNMPLFKENRHNILCSDVSTNIVNLNGQSIEKIIKSNHFGSINHLNKNGAEIITKELLKRYPNIILDESTVISLK